MPSPRFSLGRTVATPGAVAALERNRQTAPTFLIRHQIGDWGDLDDHDRRENERAVDCGFRLFSAYTLSDRTRIWIITEADRSSTCVLLPEEY